MHKTYVLLIVELYVHWVFESKGGGVVRMPGQKQTMESVRQFSGQVMMLVTALTNLVGFWNSCDRRPLHVVI